MIAYVILAHQHPAHLARLVAALADDEAEFHVHVDAKVEISPFSAALEGSATHLLPNADRVAINWAGFSMVLATLRLLEQAHRSGADRFVLLSGADYPVWPTSKIKELLGEDREFMQIDRLLDPSGNSHFDRCANRIFVGDSSVLNPRTGLPLLVRPLDAITRQLPRVRPYDGQIYYGSQWWALTRHAVTEVLSTYWRHPERVTWFRTARSPDEMVFQTLIKASSRARHVAFDWTTPGPRFSSDRAALHYANWSRPNPQVPRTVDLGDYDSIVESGALFVRKIDPVRSGTLLTRLDEHREADSPS